MDECEINDIRTNIDFKGITFSKYKKTDAKKELLNSLQNGKIEYALHWSAEFICIGAFIDLWDILLNFVGKHIHLGNPKLPIYLLLRFNNFKQIIENGYIGSEITMRNNLKIRKLFGEIIIIICQSKKKHSIESIKIKKTQEFDMTTMSNKLKAQNITYASEIYKKNDPKELFVSINEFIYHLSNDSLNSLEACYWFEWILEFENICKRRKESCLCERRTFVNVDENFQKDPIWMIWDALFNCTNKNIREITKKILKSIFDLFCIKYTNGSKRKRKYLIYFAISLLTENVNDTIPIIENKSVVDNINKKVNLIYKEIKKNEKAPATDYLFNGIEKSNSEKTNEKLDILNTAMVNELCIN
jgi:hypothetical protein